MNKTELEKLSYTNCKKITAENLSDPIIEWGQHAYFDGFIEGYNKAIEELNISDDEITTMLENEINNGLMYQEEPKDDRFVSYMINYFPLIYKFIRWRYMKFINED